MDSKLKHLAPRAGACMVSIALIEYGGTLSILGWMSLAASGMYFVMSSFQRMQSTLIQSMHDNQVVLVEALIEIKSMHNEALAEINLQMTSLETDIRRSQDLLNETDASIKEEMTKHYKENEQALNDVMTSISVAIDNSSNKLFAQAEDMHKDMLDRFTSGLKELSKSVDIKLAAVNKKIDSASDALSGDIDSLREKMTSEFLQEMSQLRDQFEDGFSVQSEKIDSKSNEIIDNERNNKKALEKLITESKTSLQDQVMEHMIKSVKSVKSEVIRLNESNLTARYESSLNALVLKDLVERLEDSVIESNEMGQKIIAYLRKEKKKEAQNAVVDIKQKDPNREEVIYDETNNAKLVEQYKEGLRNKSKLYVDGKLKYEAQYEGESVRSSKSYDEKGQITLEETFYPFGAVKERIEYSKERNKIYKEITKFNENGSIIKEA